MINKYKLKNKQAKPSTDRFHVLKVKTSRPTKDSLWHCLITDCMFLTTNIVFLQF